MLRYTSLENSGIVMETNNLKASYGTLSQTINALGQLGYSHDFNIQEDCIVCHRANVSLAPEDFQIDQVYRFDGDSDPDYQAILYAISSPNFGIKGVLVDGYGTASEEKTAKLIEKLEVHRKQVQSGIKANEATPQHPEGDRVILAPMVEMNLTESIKQIKSESTWTEGERNSITLFKSDTMRIVLIGLHKNAEMKAHKANGVISVQVLEGEMEFATEAQTLHLKSSQMITLQENIMHSVKAVSECFFLLTLSVNKH